MKTPRTKPLDWDSMTPSERAVAVAKDVITQVKQKAFVATRGTYLTQYGDLSNLDPEADLRANLSKLKGCQVCARGAVFLCYVRLFDQVAMQELGEATAFSRDVFGDDIDLIEGAFEGWNVDEESDDVPDLRLWGCRFPDPKLRLIAIMENVIENNGRFVPWPPRMFVRCTSLSSGRA